MSTELPDFDDVVEGRWPYDGPHDADTVIDAAGAVNLLVRYMNNASQYRHTLTLGPDLYRLLGRLHGAVAGLPQLLQQLTAAADRLQQDNTLYDDRRDRPGALTAGELVAALTDEKTLAALGTLGAALGRAHGLAAHLGHSD